MKSILRRKANFDILEGFLQALLGEPITIEQLLESENNADEMQKFNRVDLLVHDSKGRKLIIEIQTAPESYYLQRLLFGVCKVITENLDLGASYGKIAKVISISILYFNLGLGDDYVYVGKTELVGLNTHKILKRRQTSAIKLANTDNIFPEYYLINIERFKNNVRDALYSALPQL
jgi:predicted transposase/invertase (TIGR01784 family)